MTQILSRRSPAMVGACADPRWTVLGLVQKARDLIGVKDRDITVLRGLLTLIPAERWITAPYVHASNRCLQERCDGIDERTLRRRLARLCDLGLIIRRQSPNRKRYQVKDADGAVLIAYGFDLSPLRDGLAQLQVMAEESEAESRRIAALRGQLRHLLFQIEASGCPPETDLLLLREAALTLRRKASSEQLAAMVDQLQPLLKPQSEPMVLTDRVRETLQNLKRTALKMQKSRASRRYRN